MRTLLLALLWASTPRTGSSHNCYEHNFCSGHGSCVVASSTCSCYEGWGSDVDIASIKAPDCSLRTCPAGRAWGDVAVSATDAHAMAECSARGKCDTANGVCQCFQGFEGEACQRKSCPNQCSGHGRCLSMREMATVEDALPLGPSYYEYSGQEHLHTWDEDMLYGCVCDSSWPVGLSRGQTQEPEWFGYDCSLRHCPSGDDPRTTSTDETDCLNITAAGGHHAGHPGNKCHVDCSNRGNCDYKTGLCRCYDGFHGDNCGNRTEFHEL